MTVDLAGLADKTKEEVAALWQRARAEGAKAEEYIVRDHFTQQFGGEPSAVTEDAPQEPEPAPEVSSAQPPSDEAAPVQEPATEEAAAE